MSESIFTELFQARYCDLIPHFDEFIESLILPRPQGLRLNPRLCSIPSFVSRFNLSHADYHTPIEGLNYIEVAKDKSFWGGSLEHHLGFYYIQALSSLLPVLALNPNSKDRVLDMCAAPGGKTTHLAELMDRCGVLVANEPHLGRRRILKASLSRLGVPNTLVTTLEGQKLPFAQESFSKILLDGPCSSEGTLRADSIKPSRKSDRAHLTYNKAFRSELHQVQAQLLEHAYRLLSPGGTLVYSTCTYDPMENEAQVQKILDNHSDMNVVSLDIDSQWDSFLVDGTTQYNQHYFDKSLAHSKRIYPHHLNSIGFYVSKLIKSS